MEKILGQPIIIINKPGASQTIATASLVTAKPDGYTIGYISHLGLFFGPIKEKVPYNPLLDLKYIIQFGTTYIGVTVKGNSPFKVFGDVIEFARQNPKKLSYGSAGTGTLGHLVMEQIAKKEKVQFTHIPFKGGAETQAALLGGHILVGTGVFTHSLLEAGEIRLLFLITDEHSSEYPNIPILKDLGYDIPAMTPMVIAAPKNTPENIIKKLEESFHKAIKDPFFIKGMKDLRYSIIDRTGKELYEYIYNSYYAYDKLLKEMGFAK